MDTLALSRFLIHWLADICTGLNIVNTHTQSIYRPLSGFTGFAEDFHGNVWWLLSFDDHCSSVYWQAGHSSWRLRHSQERGVWPVWLGITTLWPVIFILLDKCEQAALQYISETNLQPFTHMSSVQSISASCHSHARVGR